MKPGMSPSATYIPLITLCILTTSYCRQSVIGSLRPQPLPRQPRFSERGISPSYAAGTSCSSGAPNRLQDRNPRSTAYGSLPSQTQQLGGKRLVYPLSYLFNTALSSTIRPPTISSRRDCAWNNNLSSCLAPPRCSLSAGIEATAPLKILAEGRVVKSDARGLNSLNLHRHAPCEKRDKRLADNWDYSPHCAVRPEPLHGRGVRNWVKALRREAIGSLQSGGVDSTSYASVKRVLAAGTEDGTVYGGRVLVSPLPPLTHRGSGFFLSNAWPASR
jgi:hypothetical protein